MLTQPLSWSLKRRRPPGAEAPSQGCAGEWAPRRDGPLSAQARSVRQREAATRLLGGGAGSAGQSVSPSALGREGTLPPA